MAKSSRYASTRLATTVNARYFPDEHITDAYYLDGRFTGKRETRAADSTNDREDRGFLFALFSYQTELGERPADAPFASTVAGLSEAVNRSSQPIDSQINDLADLAVEVGGKATLPQPGVRQTYFSGVMVKDGEIAAVTTNSGCAFLYRGDVLYPLTAGEFNLEAIDMNGNPVDHLNDYSAGVAGTIRYSNVAELMQNDCLVLCNKEVLEILGQREILRLLNEAEDQEDAAANIITAASAKQPGTPVQMMISFVEYIQPQEKPGRGFFSTGQVPAVQADSFPEPMYREERASGPAAAAAAAAGAAAYRQHAPKRDEQLWQRANRERQNMMNNAENRTNQFAEHAENAAGNVTTGAGGAYDQMQGRYSEQQPDDRRFETRVYGRDEFMRDQPADQAPAFPEANAAEADPYADAYRPEYDQNYSGSYEPEMPYDPNAAYEPQPSYDSDSSYASDEGYGYDPNQNYDQAYDPNAAYSGEGYDQPQYDPNRYEPSYGSDPYGEGGDGSAYQDPYAPPAYGEYGDESYYNEGDQYSQSYDQNYPYEQDPSYGDNYYDEYRQSEQDDYDNSDRIKRIIFYVILALVVLALGFLIYKILSNNSGNKPRPELESSNTTTLESTTSPSAETTPSTTPAPTTAATTTEAKLTDEAGNEVTKESGENGESGSGESKAADGQSQSYVIKDGDYLYNIMLDYYGVYDEAMAIKLAELNPDSIAPDLNIRTGQTIILPPIEQLQP